ncbi:MAG: radical SAM protein [Candidatus Omnitrophota bacterium]
MVKVAFIINTVGFSIPLGIAYLSGILNKNSCQVDIFEVGRNPSRAIKDIKSFNPDIVGYSVITGEQNFYLDFNRKLKKALSFLALFGGPHATFFPETVEEDSVDCVCIGEGELALEEFVREFSKSREVPDKIQNFWIKKKDIIIKNPLRPRVNDLDLLPLPERKIFYDKFQIINRHGIKHFLANKGCPYQCTYCFNKSYNDLYKNTDTGSICRSRAPKNICDEINIERKKTIIKMVAFIDDSFTLNKGWVKDFTRVYKKTVGLPFSINTRFDLLNDEVISYLKEANCSLIYVGVESGNEFVRNSLLNRKMSLDTIYRSSDLIKKHNIKFLTENIIGIPGEGFDMALDTLKVNMHIKPNFAGCSFFNPYPKLKLTDYAIEKNYFNGDFSRLRDSYFYDPPIRQKNKKELNRILNLRCFFSLLAAYPRLFNFFKKFILDIPHNRVFRRLADVIDGYYLKKCLPYKKTLLEDIKAAIFYLTRYRKG